HEEPPPPPPEPEPSHWDTGEDSQAVVEGSCQVADPVDSLVRAVGRERHTTWAGQHRASIRAAANDSRPEGRHRAPHPPVDHRQPKPGQRHLATTPGGRGTAG